MIKLPNLVPPCVSKHTYFYSGKSRVYTFLRVVATPHVSCTLQLSQLLQLIVCRKLISRITVCNAGFNKVSWWIHIWIGGIKVKQRATEEC